MLRSLLPIEKKPIKAGQSIEYLRGLLLEATQNVYSQTEQECKLILGRMETAKAQMLLGLTRYKQQHKNLIQRLEESYSHWKEDSQERQI